MDGDTVAIISGVAAAVSGSLGYIWRMQQQAHDDRKIEQREENRRAATAALPPAPIPSPPGGNGYVRPEKVAEMLNIHQDRCTKAISNTLANMAMAQRAAHEEVRSDINRLVDSLDQFKGTVIERLADQGARIKVLEDTTP